MRTPSHQVMEGIRGAEQLIAVFGYWPSFHDAEVLRVALSREGTGVDHRSPWLELDVYAYDTDGTLTPDGYYRLTNEVIVSFRFHGVDAVKLEDFNGQNVLWELTIAPAVDPDGEPVLEVELPSTYGLAGSFRCRAAEVVDVRPRASRSSSS